MMSGEREIEVFGREDAAGADVVPLRGSTRRRPGRPDGAGDDGDLGPMFGCLAGRDVDELSWRDRSLRRRAGRGGVDVAAGDIAFAGSSRPSSTMGRGGTKAVERLRRVGRHPSPRSVLIVRADA